MIPSYYPPTYAVYGDDPVVGWLFRITYWLDARRVARLIGPRGRVLDVGCGAGGALNALAGVGEWDVCGLELDAEAARQAVRRGSTCGRATWSTPTSPESFDLIRMGHVIEHVRDPIATLRRAWELLRPGGILFGETPNIDCWDSGSSGATGARSTSPATSRCSAPRRSSAPASRPASWDAHRPAPAHGRVERGHPELARRSGRSPGSANGRVRWYPALIAPFLPVTILQSLVSRTATMAFIARRPEA